MHAQTHQPSKQPFLPKRASAHHPAQPVQVTNIIARHPLQAKLTVGAPNDHFEQEADRVADRVMRMPNPAAARSGMDATPHSAMSIQRKCSACEDEALQRKPDGSHSETPSTGLDSVAATLRQSGRPLDAGTRNYFEPRFGADFSNVRIHTDTNAAASARSVNALAYTVGRDVVFNSGQYAPHRDAGKRLLAHELTHVVQQSGGLQRATPMTNSIGVDTPDDTFEREADAVAEQIVFGADKAPRSLAVSSPSIQRTCGPSAIIAAAPPGCSVGNHTFVSGTLFKFDKDCDDFAPGQEAALISFASALPPTATLEIHSYTSVDAATFNEQLSCVRSSKAQSVLTAALPSGAGITASRITAIVDHGPTPGPAAERRSVVIRVTTPTIAALPKCGPDATDWFVLQVNTAMADPAVLAIQSDIATADSLARRHGTTAAAVAEGGAAARVLAEEAKLAALGPTPPPRNPTIDTQLLTGVATGAAATLALTPTSLFDRRLIDAPNILRLILRAATNWAALVTHGARYDFKAHVMNHPKSTHCPEPGCVPKEVGTITLCPGAASENCYESDLPGNIFYALIGRHIGWSENTLQLGSQLAELTDLPRTGRPVITWDTPDDTTAIRLGFGFPLPLSRAVLCSVVPPARSTLSLPATSCADCPDPTTAAIL